jgi:hypothetical protein
MDGQRVSATAKEERIKDDDGCYYYRDSFWCVGCFKEAFIYEKINRNRVSLQVICRSSNA